MILLEREKKIVMKRAIEVKAKNRTGFDKRCPNSYNVGSAVERPVRERNRTKEPPWQVDSSAENRSTCCSKRLHGENRLRRILGPVTLTSLGVGAIIGTGIFVLTGVGRPRQGRARP